MDCIDPSTYQQRRDSFTRSLHHFHETRGTAFKRVPEFCGVEVDLFRLYNLVTERGGWLKVNRTNGWDDLLEFFHLPKNCVNGGNALKQIYLRFLDRYEKVHYLGEAGDRNDDEEDVESRHRRWSARAMHTVALTYNHHQHNVGENVRRVSGLSTDLHRPSEYDRLALSLVSPLPNEQDFAINVCTLLSNEGKHVLRLDKCPRLLEYLLAHAGVYNHCNLRILFEEIYGRVRGQSLSTFWSDVLESPDFKDLTDENKFPTRRREKTSSAARSPTRRAPSPELPPQIELPVESPAMVVVETDKLEVTTTVATPLPAAAAVTPVPVAVTQVPVAATQVPVAASQVPASATPVPVAATPMPAAATPMLAEATSESAAATPMPAAVTPVLAVATPEPASATPVPAATIPVPAATTPVTQSEPQLLLESENRTAIEGGSTIDGGTSAEPSTTGEETKVAENDGKVECDSTIDQNNKGETEATVESSTTGEEGSAAAETVTEGEATDAKNASEEAVAEEEKKVETPEEAAERIRLAQEAEEAARIENEKRLAREAQEAEHYEALLRIEESKRKGPSQLIAEASCSQMIGERKRKRKIELQIEDGDNEIFNLGRGSGTQDVIGQRVLQVANILRNLSFSEEVAPLMARNTTFLRFLLLCANARWANLHQLGLDMLGNIAPEIPLEDPMLERINQVLFGTVSRGIRHCDRFIVLSSLEVLNKVCQRDENEDIISRNLDHLVYEQVCRLLSLHDIMILLYTLECLYSMSSMGEKACNYICRSRGAMQMLLSLITVEAQSYGPKACILMRVIETVSGGSGQLTHPTQYSPSVQTISTPLVTPTVIATPQKIIAPQLMRAPSPKTVVGMPMGAVATPVPVPNPCPTIATAVTTTVITPTVPSAAPLPTTITMPSVQQQHAHQQTVQENEQFAQAWVRANYELSVGGKVEQHEMYKRYLDSCAKMERKGVITAMHFPRIVRSVFGGTVGPKPNSNPAPGTVPQPVYDGIQVRETPLTINIKLVPMTEVPSTVPTRRRGGVSPILKAQLVSPPGRTTPPLSTPISSPALPQSCSALTTQASGGSPAANSTTAANAAAEMDSSSLIKSLLASKVTQRQAQQAKLLNAQNVPQMASATKGTATTTAKLTRINGVIQEPPVESNHLPPVGIKGKKEPPQPPPRIPNKLDPEDSDSRASSSRDFPTTGGTQSSTEDNENSLTSFEGIFLNGIDLGAAVAESAKTERLEAEMTLKTSSDPPKTKSLMLADLLDKKEAPLLNGVIGEKGLELVEKAILADKPVDKMDNVNNGVDCGDSHRTSVSGDEGVKRHALSDLRDDAPDVKRPRMEQPNTVVDIKDENGDDSSRSDKQELNGEEEVRASSKAANLFAALAAEALEDEMDLEVVPSDEDQLTATAQIRPIIIGEQQPLIVTASPGGAGGTRQIIMAPSQSGQVLISTGGQLTLQKSSTAASTAAGQSVPVVLQNQRIVQTGVAQQYIMSGNAASPMLLTPGGGTVIQGQTQTVLLTQTSQQQGTSAKTIIILQPQPSATGAAAQQQKLVLTSQGGNVVVGRPLSESPPALVSSREVPEVSITQNGSQLHVVRSGSSLGGSNVNPANSSNGCQQIQVISSGVQNNAPILAEKCGVGLDHSIYLCEWRSCMRSFKAASDVYLHVCSCHCPVDPEQETQCLWGRCDGMKRKRFSLMTHLYDRHCNADILNVMAMRRRQLNTVGRTEIPVPPAAPPHPGYAPNAAFHAIKRHAGEFTNPKELMPKPAVKPVITPAPPQNSAVLLAKAASTPIQVKDDNEGPVTKSIRLTASLILRNLVIFSSVGRRFLKGYEPHLANIALSNVESSRTIAQVLADMNDTSASNAR